MLCFRFRLLGGSGVSGWRCSNSRVVLVVGGIVFVSGWGGGFDGFIDGFLGR